MAPNTPCNRPVLKASEACPNARSRQSRKRGLRLRLPVPGSELRSPPYIFRLFSSTVVRFFTVFCVWPSDSSRISWSA